MKTGILDLGSNSIKFLVSEVLRDGRVFVLHQQTEHTRLGEGGEDILRETAMDRTWVALAKFRIVAEKMGVQIWKAVATSAVRSAKNKFEFETRFRACMGFDLQVLSGDEEAELIYRGVTSDRDMLREREPVLVMDVGGGSAEWICGVDGQIEQRISLDLGCVRMTERFLRGDPYTEASYLEMVAFFEEKLVPWLSIFGKTRFRMVGTGGSLCAVAAVHLGMADIDGDRLHGCKLTLSEIEALVKKLRDSTQAERRLLPSLSDRRADIVVAGSTLFATAMRLFSVPHITVSLRNLRYGLMMTQ